MKILLGMSGGLDSTFAARLLKSEGNEVVGAAIKMHGFTDVSAAQTAAKEAGVPLVIIECGELFEREVIKPFCEEYLAGRTPNPCIFCNPRVKFAVLCDYAEKNGFDKVSTGHYCGAGECGGRYFIRRAGDTRKDQSYVLWALTQKQLSILYFPLEGMKKDEIRAEAVKIGLSCAEAPESQEICFIPDGDYAAYIENIYGKTPEGDFISPEGEVCGRHHGLAHYTVGQRKRLGIALGRPVFISRIDAPSNRIYLSDAGGEFTDGAEAVGLSFQLASPFEGEISAFVKARYAAAPVEAMVTVAGTSARIRFSKPVRAVTPGQSAVFYDGQGRILFGGYLR